MCVLLWNSIAEFEESTVFLAKYPEKESAWEKYLNLRDEMRVIFAKYSGLQADYVMKKNVNMDSSPLWGMYHVFTTSISAIVHCSWVQCLRPAGGEGLVCISWRNSVIRWSQQARVPERSGVTSRELDGLSAPEDRRS